MASPVTQERIHTDDQKLVDRFDELKPDQPLGRGGLDCEFLTEDFREFGLATIIEGVQGLAHDLEAIDVAMDMRGSQVFAITPEQVIQLLMFAHDLDSEAREIQEAAFAIRRHTYFIQTQTALSPA